MKLVFVGNLLISDKCHTRTNKHIKCSTQELSQGHLQVTKVLNQRFPLQYNGWIFGRFKMQITK